MRGFPNDHVLKLNKSLYGQADALKIRCDKLRAGLEKRGFTAGKAGPCLFISKKSFRADGDKCNWEMKEESSVEKFLGINIDPN
eukprot:9011642-Ditylum_brightwellii.AAC.1